MKRKAKNPMASCVIKCNNAAMIQYKKRKLMMTLLRRKGRSNG